METPDVAAQPCALLADAEVLTPQGLRTWLHLEAGSLQTEEEEVALEEGGPFPNCVLIQRRIVDAEPHNRTSENVRAETEATHPQAKEQ